MSPSRRFTRLVALLAVLTASAALAQTPAPETAPAPGQARPHRPNPAPTNLQVLPKDLTGDQVHDIMHKFEGALGVECEYCHAENPATHRLDFASDANPVKDRARVMIRMVQEIDGRFLSQLTDPAPTNKVSCGTCHRGTAKPTVFVPPPHEHHDAPPAGAPPAAAPTH
jgi:hypothetical protein